MSTQSVSATLPGVASVPALAARSMSSSNLHAAFELCANALAAPHIVNTAIVPAIIRNLIPDLLFRRRKSLARTRCRQRPRHAAEDRPDLYRSTYPQVLRAKSERETLVWGNRAPTTSANPTP